MEVFLEMQKEYYDRLDCRYDGDSLVSDPDTLFDLANSFSFEKKKASARRQEEAQARTDFGTTRRVDPEGKARARKTAENHFGPNEVHGKKIKGRRNTRPPPGAWADAPSSMNFSRSPAAKEVPEDDDEVAGDDDVRPEPGAKKRGRPAGAGNKKVQREDGSTEKRFGAVDQAGMYKKWVLFRYADDIFVQKKREREAPPFPLLCGQVTAIAEKETAIGKLKLKRCTGDAGELKEPWALCIEWHDLEVHATGDPKRPYQLRRKPYGCHPAVSEHEKKNHHSTYHMSFDLRQRLVEKWGSKGQAKWPRSYTYVDFNNPNHKFVLLHEDAQFTSTQHLQSSTIKDLYRRNDPIMVKELNAATEEFKNQARPPKKKAKKDVTDSSSSSSSSTSGVPLGKKKDDSDSEEEDEEGAAFVQVSSTAAECGSDDDDLSEGIISDSEVQMLKKGLPIEDFCRARNLPNEEFFRAALEREFNAVQGQQLAVFEPGQNSTSSSIRNSSSTCSSSDVVNEYRSKIAKKVLVEDSDD